MFFYSILFLIGDCLLQQLSKLPDISMVTIGVFIILCIAIVLSKIFQTRKICFAALAIIIGFCWTYRDVYSLLSWQLPHDIENKKIIITGKVASIPTKNTWGTRFDFYVEDMEVNQKKIITKQMVRLNWHDALAIKGGETWQFEVRLKRIHTPQNPGTFDFEAWSLMHHLRATGSVVSSASNQLLFHHWYHFPLLQFREALQNRLRLTLPNSPSAIWLITLITGEHQQIPEDYWEILRKTGTNHLMAVAGLHIGMCASLFYCVIYFLWRRSSYLLLRLPAQIAACYASIFAAFVYSLLSGFTLPTERACIMLCVFMFMRIYQLRINAWSVWSLALLGVFIINPLQVLSESFWLSFVTIACIIFSIQGRQNNHPFLWKFTRVQWVIALGLLPLSLFFFQEVSLVGVIANTIAIPWLEFLILPFCLLAASTAFISNSMTHCLLTIANFNLYYLWQLLTWFASLSVSIFSYAISSHVLLIAIIICTIISLLPQHIPAKKTSMLLLFMIIVSYHSPKPKAGNVWLSVLDVGQGLSIVLQTKKHILIYDAGPKFNANLDAGKNILAPYLKQLHVKRIHELVVSHSDNDHAGGVEALLKTFPVKHISASAPEKLHAASDYCLANTHWQWDGIDFTFLYPTENALHADNDSSCVLRIDNGEQSILLTGDIENTAEKKLLMSNQPLHSTILIAPHHGSKTSDNDAFIKAVMPTIVVYATGYQNRYHFPHLGVIEKYRRIDAKQFNTAISGMIFFKLEKNQRMSIDSYRTDHKKYWYD